MLSKPYQKICVMMRMMLIYVPGSKHGTDSNKVAQNPQNKRTIYMYGNGWEPPW